jgi:glycosidase
MADLWKALVASLFLACSTGEAPPPAEAPVMNVPESTPAPPNAPSATPPKAEPSAPVPFDVWRRTDPIYELYVRHFSEKGNFKGVEEKLPELKALGVGIVWLLPVNEIGSKAIIDGPHGNPYAVKSYEKLNPEYGSEADLKSLVDRAHELGMHVILDWVPNHTAWDNPLIEQHPDWYVHENGSIKPVSKDEFAWIAQLDWKKPALREYMIGVMESWVEKFELDGFRIDFAHSMPLEFFGALRTRLEKVRPVFLLAEAGNVDFHPTFDMTYDWDVYPMLGEVAHASKAPSAIDDVLLNRQLIPYAQKPDALVMRMTYNHDDNGRFTLTERYRDGIKAFAVLACTLPGKPLVFDGQEVGYEKSLGHDPKVKIDWNDPQGFRPFYTKLLRLFRASSALHHAGMADFRKIDTSPSARTYAFVRRDGADKTVLVTLNFSPDAIDTKLTPATNAGSISGDYVELFSGDGVHLDDGDEIHLDGWGYRVAVRGPTE